MEDESYTWPPLPPRPVTPTQYHTEVVLDGKTLENYTKREPLEDGKYVLVTTHTERLEKVKQPLTPQEIAEQKKTERVVAIVVGTVVVGFLGLLGYAAHKEEKRAQQEGRHLHAVPDEPTSGT